MTIHTYRTPRGRYRIVDTEEPLVEKCEVDHTSRIRDGGAVLFAERENSGEFTDFIERCDGFEDAFNLLRTLLRAFRCDCDLTACEVSV